MNVTNLIDTLKCPITKEEIYDLSTANDSVYYKVKVNGSEFSFAFCKKCFDEIDFIKYRSTIFGLILNGKIDINTSDLILHWDEKKEDVFNLKQFLIESYYPRTPQEKYDNLLSKLYDEQTEIGEGFLYYKLEDNLFFEKCYFTATEFIGYLNDLENEKLIECHYPNPRILQLIKITFKGFKYLHSLEKNGSESKNCFIAMAFRDETVKARKSIKNAIIKTGFFPIIIDEENIDSDQTINDAIIAGIKKSKFCIADFSYHRNGVYFESGYALGLGKPVIYCCSKDEFKNAHFDIKPLQHIVYESSEELEKKLIDKIEAWIK